MHREIEAATSALHPRLVARSLGIVFLVLGSLVLPAGRAAAASPPLWSWSHYVTSVADLQVFQDSGCTAANHADQGTRPKDAAIILDFGEPRIKNGNMAVNLSYEGSDTSRWATIPDIRQAAQKFAVGFYNCADNSADHLYLGIGVNNGYDDFAATDANLDAHGQALGTAVTNANDWAQSNGYSGRVIFVGANDMETGWGSSNHTRTWVAGYNKTNGAWALYDFGDAGGCPQSSIDPNSDPTCSASWHVSDVTYVAWGAPSSYPFPEIYRTDAAMAKQWKWLDVWSIQAKNRDPMNFTSSLAESGANPPSDRDNSPDDAWTQLYNRINCNDVQSGCLTWDNNSFRSANIEWGF